VNVQAKSGHDGSGRIDHPEPSIMTHRLMDACPSDLDAGPRHFSTSLLLPARPRCVRAL
jgi:hypothetical protein